MVSHAEWIDAQKWERDWHADCVNSYNEETKQYIYAHYMGLDLFSVNYYGQRSWDFGNKTVLDVGCGPYSMLLKIKTTGRKYGIDPCEYPKWIMERYKAASVDILQFPAERLGLQYGFIADAEQMNFDEILLYNCLQHTSDPAAICRNLINAGKTIRVFEWVDAGVSPGHLHDLKADKLDEWLGGRGRVIELNQSPVVGRAYCGIFKGKHYNVGL